MKESFLRGVCFELYSEGLTTRQTGEVIENSYGHHDSALTVSLINFPTKLATVWQLALSDIKSRGVGLIAAIILLVWINL